MHACIYTTLLDLHSAFLSAYLTSASPPSIYLTLALVRQLLRSSTRNATDFLVAVGTGSLSWYLPNSLALSPASYVLR